MMISYDFTIHVCTYIHTYVLLYRIIIFWSTVDLLKDFFELMRYAYTRSTAKLAWFQDPNIP